MTNILKIALGTAQFGLNYGVANQSGQVSRTNVDSILRCARASGIDTLDTAINYGDSESVLGAAGVRDFKLISKLPALPAGCGDVGAWVAAQVTASRARLGVDTLAALLLHWPADLLGPHGAQLYRALGALVGEGVVRKLGVSIYAPSELVALCARYRFDLVQAPLSLIDRRLLSSGWLDRLKDGGTEVHTRSAFLQGLLLMPRTAIPGKFARWDPVWDAWHSWLAANDVSAVEASLAFPLGVPGVDRVVVGVDGEAQLAGILRAASSRVTIAAPPVEVDSELLINPSLWSSL